MAYTKVLVELADTRGNVIVAVDSGARFGGTLRRLPKDDVAIGDVLDVMLIFGDEPCTLSVTSLERCTSAPGRAFRAEVKNMDVGGIHLVPPRPGQSEPRVELAAEAPPPPVVAPAVAIDVAAAARVEVTEPVPAVVSVELVRANVAIPGLRGRLQDVPFAEIVQLLCAAKRTATVEVTRGYNTVGTLGFTDGRAVWASGCGRDGADAFYALAALDDGDFAVHYGKPSPIENLHGDTLYLLLEAARRADESRRDSQVPQSADSAMSAVARIEDVASVVAAAVDAAIAGGPPPPSHPRRRKTDRLPAEPTSPGRRASTNSKSGMFSGFFEEFSTARERQRDPSRPVPRPRAAAPAKSDDIAAAPPFASLAFQSTEQSGDRDTDIISSSAISAS